MRKKIRNIITVFCLVLALISVRTVPAIAGAEEGSLPVVIEVNAVYSVTIEDQGISGIIFDKLVPGIIDQPEVNQDGTGAVAVINGIENNVSSDIKIKADPFQDGSAIMPIENVKWGLINDIAESLIMNSAYVRVGILEGGTTMDLYFWLSVPEDQPPGTYNTTFYFQSDRVTNIT